MGVRRLIGRLRWRLEDEPPPQPHDRPEPPFAPELSDLLRRYGSALCLSGDTAERIQAAMEELARAYGVHDVHFFVLPTGVFVRVVRDGGATVDFAAAEGEALRLDQVARLYELLAEIERDPVPPAEASRRLAAILAARPRFPPLVTVVGHTVLTVGLGMMLNADLHALLGLVVLGAFVGVLRLVAERARPLSLALPVAVAMLVTFVAYRFGEVLGVPQPVQLVIPPLVTLLPGAALTMGAVEMARGSTVGGASRAVSGVYGLLLLAFGIVAGAQLAGPMRAADSTTVSLGWWAPWIGVLVFGIGQYLFSAAPPRTLGWLLLVLYGAWIAQFLGGRWAGGLFGAFAGGLVVVQLAALVQRHRGLPAQVVFLPAFWLLVPGALGLTGVSELVTAHDGGASNLGMAFLTIIAIALGVLVGSSFNQRTHARQIRPRAS